MTAADDRAKAAEVPLRSLLADRARLWDSDRADMIAEIMLPTVAAALAAARADEAQRWVARLEQLAAPGDPNARMDAYYYGFERTGVGIVDEILSAVATAGKHYHSTSEWADDCDLGGPSEEACIQAAADHAAARLRGLTTSSEEEQQ